MIDFKLAFIGKRVVAEFFNDSIPTVAGGITFFVLLALFPAVGSIVSIYGFFADRSDITRHLATYAGFLPEGAITVLRSELERVASRPPAVLGMGFVISTLIALWSASGGYKALVEGLNVAFEVRETRSFIKLSLNAMVFTAGAALLFLAALFLSIAAPVAISQTSPNLRGIYDLVVWPLSFILCVLVLAGIYRMGPDRTVKGSWVTWGSATASLLWLSGTQVFTWYAQNYGSYNDVYGQLGALVGFLTWVWLTLMIVLLGAEINCEVEKAKIGAIGDQTPISHE